MTDIEKRARELLAAEWRKSSDFGVSGRMSTYMVGLIEKGEWDEAADMRAIRTALTPQWQPIETAPKDGTTVLVCDRLGDCSVASYWARKPTYWDGNWGDGEYETRPSHWMPLPAAPEVSP